MLKILNNSTTLKMTKDSNISILPSGATCKHAIRKWRGGDTRQRMNYDFFPKKKTKQIDDIESIIDNLPSKILYQLTKTLFIMN